MKQTLSTKTTVSKTGDILSIYTVYSDALKSILAFISDTVKSINFVNFKQGELGIIKDGYNDVRFSLNNKGELIVSGSDVNRFDIADDGNLTITE